MKKIKAILIGAGQRGMGAYAPYALEHPNEFEIIAVADADIVRNNQFRELYNLNKEVCFMDWKEVLNSGIEADVVMVCTQDDLHFEPTKLALKKGYNILLEKPMSNKVSECIRIGELAQEYNKSITVCHVLRYTDFFIRLKKL